MNTHLQIVPSPAAAPSASARLTPGDHLLSHGGCGYEGAAAILDALAEATKHIAAELRAPAGAAPLVSGVGRRNIHGEDVTRMDQSSHNAVVGACMKCHAVASITSEEEEGGAVEFPDHPSASLKLYVDPLDGSSNLGVDVTVGTIFGAYSVGELQPGRKQMLAGYAVYGPATRLVYTAGFGVHMFTLDPAIGDYILTATDVKMPPRGNIYSINQAYERSFRPELRRFLKKLADERSYSLRYVGSLVADFHRTLLNGGIFLYPGSKLRLMYEANPLARIAEEAGGLALTNGSRPVLDVEPADRHERIPFFCGSAVEMTELAQVMGVKRGSRMPFRLPRTSPIKFFTRSWR